MRVHQHSLSTFACRGKFNTHRLIPALTSTLRRRRVSVGRHLLTSCSSTGPEVSPLPFPPPSPLATPSRHFLFSLPAGSNSATGFRPLVASGAKHGCPPILCHPQRGPRLVTSPVPPGSLLTSCWKLLLDKHASHCSFKPASFAWFKTRYYAPALGFLMFAVGVNLRAEAFLEVFRHPRDLLLGVLGQWVIKPLLGFGLASVAVPLLGLPSGVGTGLLLVSCVSGAQLSSYASYLVSPEHAPLAIVLTALSTAAGVALTPALALLLMGTRIPVDARGMMLSIVQIVLVPVVAGLACSQFVPGLVRRCKPGLASLSLLDTCACVGASLASNSASLHFGIGAQIAIPVAAFHWIAFSLGHALARGVAGQGAEVTGLARCISLVTGMQSSLLALLLASRFFADPLIALTAGISTIVMTLSGFFLVMFWKAKDSKAPTSQVA